MYGSVGGSVGITRGNRDTKCQQVFSPSFLSARVFSSHVVVGGRVVVAVVVVGNKVVVVCLSFFFPFLSLLGFLVGFGPLGSFCFFLSFFFFFSSFTSLFTLPTTPGKVRKHHGEVP